MRTEQDRGEGQLTEIKRDIPPFGGIEITAALSPNAVSTQYVFTRGQDRLPSHFILPPWPAQIRRQGRMARHLLDYEGTPVNSLHTMYPGVPVSIHEVLSEKMASSKYYLMLRDMILEAIQFFPTNDHFTPCFTPCNIRRGTVGFRTHMVSPDRPVMATIAPDLVLRLTNKDGLFGGMVFEGDISQVDTATKYYGDLREQQWWQQERLNLHDATSLLLISDRNLTGAISAEGRMGITAANNGVGFQIWAQFGGMNEEGMAPCYIVQYIEEQPINHS
jgi:hypothetical protein